MRVTGGKYLRRVVKCPPGVIRPAMDRMRESVFAILGDLEGQKVLDLFSGSGILALESLSRGAESADLVEADPGKKKVIQENFLGVIEPWRLHLTTVEHFLRSARGSWDLIILDPPFAYSKKMELIDIIEKRKILNSGGRIILHHPTDEILIFSSMKLLHADSRKYGGSTVDFLIDNRK